MFCYVYEMRRGGLCLVCGVKGGIGFVLLWSMILIVVFLKFVVNLGGPFRVCFLERNLLYVF